MDKSELRIRPGFLLGLVIFLVVLVCLGSLLVIPSDKDHTRAKRIRIQTEERIMVELLQENASKLGGLTNVSKDFIFNSLEIMSGKDGSLFHTNVSGELIDIWQTPYRIELIGPTNFVIHSAGKNQKFGDEDDIVFNSASNDFVRPCAILGSVPVVSRDFYRRLAVLQLFGKAIFYPAVKIQASGG